MTKVRHTKFIISMLLVALLLSVVFVLILIVGPKRGNPEIPASPEPNPLSKSNTETVYRILPSTDVINGTVSQVNESTLSIIQDSGNSYEYELPENIILNCISTRSTINIKALLLDSPDTAEASASLHGDVPSHEIPYLRQEVKKDLEDKLEIVEEAGVGTRISVDRNVISVTGLSLNKLFDLVTIYLEDPRGCREN